MKVVTVPRLPGETETVEDLDRGEALQAVTEGRARLVDETPSPDEFDPSAKSVEEVLAHLDSADVVERQRVLDAEAAGKGRKTITGWQPTNGKGESA